MAKKPKIFRINLTIAKSPKGLMKYKSFPVPLLIFAESYERAMIVAEESVQELLEKEDAYIKAKKHTEIKVISIINDFKNTEE